MPHSEQRAQMPKMVRAFLMGTVTFGALALLRGQELSPVPNTDSDALELRQSSESPQARAQDYVISPDDQLEIFVLDVPEISRPYCFRIRSQPPGLRPPSYRRFSGKGCEPPGWSPIRVLPSK
jgi:hypothetical protein